MTDAATKSTRSLKVLMVEDDADLCAGWSDVFELIGHRLTCYQRAFDALADREAILSADLLISDFYLPDMNGVDLIQRVRELKPDLSAILLTGSRDASVLEAARKLSACHILHKPVNIEDIESEINKLVAA